VGLTRLQGAALAAAVLAFAAAPCGSQEAPEGTGHPPTLDELFSEANIVSASLSPSGKFLAAVVRDARSDLLLLVDLATGERKFLQRTGFDDAGEALLVRMKDVYWKSDERMLLRTNLRPKNPRTYDVPPRELAKLGDRLFAINREGVAKPLLVENRDVSLRGALDLGEIVSFLPKDPEHILMLVDGFNGRALFKVDVETGRGEQVEAPSENVVGWWLDVVGNPVVRVSAYSGTVRLYSKNENGRWRSFYKMRVRDMQERDDYEPVGPSSDPSKYYVLARPPGHDRSGLYLYDLERNEFGEPVAEHERYDLLSARIARDGSHVLVECYVADVRVCDFSDPGLDAHMRGLRKFFEESANVYVTGSSEDGQTVLLYVEGPHDPPAYYYYRTATRDIQPIGLVRNVLSAATRPRASSVTWKARDGLELSGYLTVPAGAAERPEHLPLVVYPHGGPETRDRLTFDPWVQYFAARGYAVFQPNFRGSDGFGRAFAESGYGEWGRKMQDDITDGVEALADRGSVDPERICIVGASYGGYAALAGAALTPDLFRCAVSVAGIADLDAFIRWRRDEWGADSEGYTYWLKAIGDPKADAKRMHDVSPIAHVSAIHVPVLLIHGTEDRTVPIAQSRAMKEALDNAGNQTKLIEFSGEGHSYWSDADERRALEAVDAFLAEHIGPGYGRTPSPVLQ
jgi:dipeptidyl aminopeptidase/acylaminoacyl peptidase